MTLTEAQICTRAARMLESLTAAPAQNAAGAVDAKLQSDAGEVCDYLRDTSEIEAKWIDKAVEVIQRYHAALARPAPPAVLSAIGTTGWHPIETAPYRNEPLIVLTKQGNVCDADNYSGLWNMPLHLQDDEPTAWMHRPNYMAPQPKASAPEEKTPFLAAAERFAKALIESDRMDAIDDDVSIETEGDEADYEALHQAADLEYNESKRLMGEAWQTYMNSGTHE